MCIRFWISFFSSVCTTRTTFWNSSFDTFEVMASVKTKRTSNSACPSSNMDLSFSALAFYLAFQRSAKVLIPFMSRPDVLHRSFQHGSNQNHRRVIANFMSSKSCDSSSISKPSAALSEPRLRHVHCIQYVFEIVSEISHSILLAITSSMISAALNCYISLC